jgi:TolA-binding protein
MDGDDMCQVVNMFQMARILLSASALPAILLAGILSVVIIPSAAHASIPNRVYRVDIHPKKGYTHITIKLQDPPSYTVAALPGNRLRLVMHDTCGPFFKKFRRYSDTNIGGLIFSRRGSDLIMTFQVASGAGWRDPSLSGITAISLDVGTSFNPGQPHPYVSGREKIWSGVEKLVRDFDPPLKPEIPFLPTDRQILKSILDDNDQQLFVAAEAALYKGSLSEAEGIFTQFASRQTPIKPLALYRLGETLYKLQKYPQALAAFREAERIWPAYLNFNPGVAFYYGDSIARSGDLTAGRTLLAHLIARLADKNYAPALLVRMADVLARQGHELEALAVYRTVAGNFKDNKANQMARLRLADRDFLSAAPWNYRNLMDVYQNIAEQASDITIREESHFKQVLLEAIHGAAPVALRRVVVFQKEFPRGVYASVCRTMREVLVAQVYRETVWVKNEPGLVRFVEEHQDYLSGCVEQPDFLSSVANAYEEAGRPIELIRFFSTLLDRQWASAGTPFMLEQIADKADLLGDTVLAEKTLRSFLRRYPGHPHVRLIMERLAGMYYAGGKYREVKDTLLWLLNKGENAQKPESYYYLGRSLWNLNDFAQAGKAMDLYVASVNASKGERGRLMPDAYYVAASAREALGDRKGALRLLESGIKLPANARNEGLLYKAGELNLLDGRKQVARDYFEQVTKNGKDPDWQKMAQQALNSMEMKTPSR